MSLFVYTNFASSLLASGIAAADTTLTVQSGDGALFPAISAGQQAAGVIEDVDGNVEVVYFTARASDTLTMVRFREGTTALDFPSGSRVELRVTAGVLASLLQADGGDTLSGTTTFSGILNAGSTGRFQGGEIVGTPLRGATGDTSNELVVPDSAAPTIGGSTILTAANVVANLPATAGLVLQQMVLMWAGASNAIPDGFVLCDGGNSTPDMRDKFIMGGGGALPTSGGSSTTAAGGDHSHGAATGGHTLTVAEIPPHGHRAYMNDTSCGGSGKNLWALDNSPSYHTTSSNSGGNNLIEDTGGGDAHSHTITTSGSHTHAQNLPPYRAIFFIMKT